MRKIKNIFILIFSVIFCSTLFSCTKGGSSVDFYAFNTVIHVESHDFAIDEDTKNSLNQLFTSLSQEFTYDHSQYSTVYQLNESGANTKIPLSDTAVEVYSISKELYDFTDKKFNPAIYPLINLWQFDDYHFPLQNFTPPAPQDILPLLTAINFDNVIVDSTAKTVNKTNADIKIDFGGILKGYAVDKAKDILSNAGHKSGYINVGSSSLYLLSVSSLGIRHPRSTNALPTILSINGENIKNSPVSTSGDYEKYHENNGVRYSHIINPLNGYPTNTGVISATVIGGTGAFGDAVTTAMCLMQHELNSKTSELVNFINKILSTYPTAQVYAVYDNSGEKEIITNKVLGEHFTLLDTEYSINKI